MSGPRYLAIRTVIVDPERGPLVQLAFKLYATDDYTLADLSDELYERGLSTRDTARHPAGQVLINRLSTMLRDRYYLGYVSYGDEEIKGRHEALIDPDLFERVQTIAESRSAAQERRRVHHHYLKGSLYCGRCDRAGTTGRIIIQRAVNRRGVEYLHFFCRNKQSGACPTRYVNVVHIEEAVEDYYATIAFDAAFIADARAQVAKTLEDQQASSQQLHKQLTSELRRLDAKEENLLNLVADGDDTVPQSKIKQKLRDIDNQRQRLTARLDETAEDLSQAAQLVELGLKLMENPRELYRRCDDQQRRLLNQAIFERLYIEDDGVSGHTLNEPFATLAAVREARQDGAVHAASGAGSGATDKNRPHPKAGPADLLTVEVLLGGTELVRCSSSTSMVELRVTGCTT